MNIVEVFENGKKIEYPSNWDECTSRQVIFIFKQAVKLLNGLLDPLEFKIRIFYFLAGIKRTKRHEQKEKMLTAVQLQQKFCNIYRCAETAGFMLREEKENLIFEYDCVSNKLPYLHRGLKKMYSPSEALFNITYGEYQVAYDLFRDFVESKDDSALNKLCAVLYRPKRKGMIGNDIRIDFNANECMRRAKWFKKIPFELRFLIYSWFAACDNYFKTGDIKIDGQLISLKSLFKQADESSELGMKDLGLTGILMSVAESGTFGAMEEVKRTNLYTVMLKLYQWRLEHQRLKSKTTSNDKN